MVVGNLSLLGFVDGITALGIIISSVSFGLFSFYKARKLEAKLLMVAGMLMIFIGLFWLGPAVEFWLVMLIGNNLNPVHLYVWLSYVWIAPTLVIAMYLGAELMMPDKKWIIVAIYAVLGVIFEILLFSMPYQSFTFGDQADGNLTDSGFQRAFPSYWLIVLFLLSLLIFLVFGFAIKAKQATGELRKKFMYLSIAFLIFFICGVADGLFLPGIYLAVWRGAMMTFSLFMYLGLKT